ncbi:unnamed protein product [Orchesella dallaii]|uniref:Uncharacterized protein n=1 Tax=Orchesella dallaii TaxID=48710 RepID=A0ABP1PNU1_9HEXA
MAKETQNAKRQQSTTISSTYFTSTSIPRDEYTTPKDAIWGDVIKHERILDKIWKGAWENTIVPKEMRPDYHRSSDRLKQIYEDNTSFYRLKPSPSIPPKASGIVGWRSSQSQNTMEFFKTQYLPQKKRFVQEQYGHYRKLKYLQNEEPSTESKNSKDNANGPPRKSIRHITKPMVC